MRKQGYLTLYFSYTYTAEQTALTNQQITVYDGVFTAE